MTPTEKKAREDRVKHAWQALAQDKQFMDAFNLDLQVTFSPVAPSFQAGDQWNATAAAFRDGQKSVIAHMARRLGMATATLDEDATPKPTEAL